MFRKKIVSTILIMVILFTTVLSGAGTKKAFALTGAGTAANPYLISTVEDFNSIPQEPNAYYILVNDLDFENIERTVMPAFGGTLDGKGYTMRNLNIVSEDGQVTALFSRHYNGLIANFTIEDSTSRSTGSAAFVVGELSGTQNGEIKNITIKNSEVTAGRDAGGIAVIVYYYSITDCTIIDTVVNGTNAGIACASMAKGGVGSTKVIDSEANATNYAGGIFADSWYGGAGLNTVIDSKITVNNTSGSTNAAAGGIGGHGDVTSVSSCYTNSDVTINIGHAGGIMGVCRNSMLSENFAENKVQGSIGVGGISGTGDSYIWDCIAKATIINTDTENGSAAGFSGGWGRVEISNSYCISTISAPNKYAIARDYYADCSYFDKDILQVDTPAGSARTQEQMFQRANYIGWNFNSTWIIDEGNAYPKLRCFN